MCPVTTKTLKRALTEILTGEARMLLMISFSAAAMEGSKSFATSLLNTNFSFLNARTLVLARTQLVSASPLRCRTSDLS